MPLFTCTRHKQNYDVRDHQQCPACADDGVVSISAAKTIREIARQPAVIVSFDWVFDFNFPWLKP
jgi:hypothetical protein